MLRTSAGLFCFSIFTLAAAAAAESRPEARERAAAAAAASCGEDALEQYLRWHNDAVHGTPAAASAGAQDEKAGRARRIAQACKAERLPMPSAEQKS
jgi:type II secretory pathway pseudopilin PulG